MKAIKTTALLCIGFAGFLALCDETPCDATLTLAIKAVGFALIGVMYAGMKRLTPKPVKG